MIGRTKCSTAVSSTVVSSTVAHQQQHRAHPYSQQQHRAHAAFSLLLQLCRPCTTWYNASTWPSRGSFPVNSFIWQDSFSFRCRSHLSVPILANSSTTDLSLRVPATLDRTAIFAISNHDGYGFQTTCRR